MHVWKQVVDAIIDLIFETRSLLLNLLYLVPSEPQGICLSPPFTPLPMLAHYRKALIHLAFKWVLKIPSKVFMLVQQAVYSLKLLLSPWYRFSQNFCVSEFKFQKEKNIFKINQTILSLRQTNKQNKWTNRSEKQTTISFLYNW